MIVFFIGTLAYAYLSFRKKQEKSKAANAPSIESGLKTKLNESSQLIEGEAKTCCVVC